MICSMTGYGRARVLDAGRDVTVEIKSVNHRYFECFIRIPRSYMQLEDRVRAYLQSRVTRGKLEVAVNIKDEDAQASSVTVNKKLFESYCAALGDVSQSYGLPLELTALTALRLPDVISCSEQESDTEAVWVTVEQALAEALAAFVERRREEGERLGQDILGKCGLINRQVDLIEADAPRINKEYELRLRQRMQELLSDSQVDEQRLLTEVAVMADKTAVDEEVVRLRAHCNALRDMFEEGVPNGKKMDFIIQEMNRETNTICSKIGDLDIKRRAIDIKVCIEKIREQVQNIE